MSDYITNSCNCTVARVAPERNHPVDNINLFLRAHVVTTFRYSLLDFSPHIFKMLCGLGIQYPEICFYSRKPSVDDVGNPSSVNAR